jgi:hypothetical protein
MHQINQMGRAFIIKEYQQNILNIWKRLIPFGLSFIGVKLSIFGANGD